MAKLRKLTDDKKTPETKKNKVVVEIFETSYAIRGDGDQERIIKLARLVDEKMKKTAKANPLLSPLKVAILVALNLAEEYANLEKDYLDLMDMLKKDDAPQIKQGTLF